MLLFAILTKAIGKMNPEAPLKDINQDMYLVASAFFPYRYNMRLNTFCCWSDYSLLIGNWGLYYIDFIRWQMGEKAPISVSVHQHLDDGSSTNSKYFQPNKEFSELYQKKTNTSPFYGRRTSLNKFRPSGKYCTCNKYKVIVGCSDKEQFINNTEANSLLHYEYRRPYKMELSDMQ